MIGTSASGEPYCFIWAPEKKAPSRGKIKPNGCPEDLCPPPKPGLIYPQLPQLLLWVLLRGTGIRPLCVRLPTLLKQPPTSERLLLAPRFCPFRMNKQWGNLKLSSPFCKYWCQNSTWITFSQIRSKRCEEETPPCGAYHIVKCYRQLPDYAWKVRSKYLIILLYSARCHMNSSVFLLQVPNSVEENY